jgi:hypothetical protein
LTRGRKGDTIDVHFGGLTGRLKPSADINFAFVLRRGRQDWPVDRCTVRGTTVTVRFATPVRDGDTLVHGVGCAAVLAATDAADMALPAFGPLPV